MSIADGLLTATILASQYTPFRARGNCSNLPIEKQATTTAVDKAAAEAGDHERFLKFFPDHDVRSELRGKRVLDFGSGYGGRTVAYAKWYGPELVCGTEPFPAQVEAGRELARNWNVQNVAFDLCTQSSVPYADGSFDAVVTFDVLEHVADPRVSLQELRRVLKPGGKLFAAFPLYRGMFSHHLDYITLFPALHLMFSPDRIVRTVNRLLAGKMAGLGVAPQPQPQLCYKKRVRVLPSLNGMGLRDFQDAATGFEILDLRKTSIFDMAFGRTSALAGIGNVTMKLPLRVSEVFTFNVSCVLIAR